MNESIGNTLLEALTCRGVLINVSIRYWRARRKLNPDHIRHLFTLSFL